MDEVLDVLAPRAAQAGVTLVDQGGEVFDLSGCDAVLTGRGSLTAPDLRRGRPRLRHVQILGRQFDHVDWRAAREIGLTLGMQPRKASWTVAEMALTFILAQSKLLFEAHAATRSGAYRRLGLEPRRTAERIHAFQWMNLPLREVLGSIVGIIGMGEIGAELALRLQPLGASVLYFKRRRLSVDAERTFEATYAAFHDVLAQAHFVVVAAPHTPETEGLINHDALAVMREDAYLINVSRGAVVDEDALVDALRNHRIRGAALDVFVHEPLPADHPLTSLDNVLLTPHIGGGTGTTRAEELWGAVERAQETLATGTIRFPLAGGRL